MTTLTPRVRPLPFCALGVALALSIGVPCAVAQQQAPPPPVRTAPPSTPVVAPPVHLPPPPAPARTAAAANRAPTPAPVLPMKHVGPPPDSVRPAAAAVAAVPANAVAQCGDGTFIGAPATTANGCAAHHGLRVIMPARIATPPPAATRVVSAPMAMQAATPAATAPPTGATMRCKDGTYLTGTPAEGRCEANGGLAGMVPSARSAPPPPSQPRRP